MGSFFSKIRLSSALSAIKSIATWFHNSAVNYSKEKNPLIRMYYDSELGSSIEQAVEKAYSASSYDTLKSFVPDWKPVKAMCKSIGNWIAHKKVQALDVSKVVYQISTGRITKDRAYHEIAKRTTAGLFTLGKLASRAGHAVAWATGKLSDTLLPDGTTDLIKKGFDIVAGETLRRVRNKIFSEENKQRVTKFVEQGLRVAHTATKKVVEAADRVLEKTSRFISDVANKIGEETRSFREKVVSTSKTIGSAVKEGVKKIWNIIKPW